MSEKKYTRDEWLQRGREMFGDDQSKWAFVCPSCGHVATVQDYKDAGAPAGAIAYSCIGRYLKDSEEAFVPGKGPCNYAGGGLFRINPVEVDGNQVFDFAHP